MSGMERTVHASRARTYPFIERVRITEGRARFGIFPLPHSSPQLYPTKFEFQAYVDDPSLEEDARYREHVASPPSSTSTKIGSVSGEKPPARHRQAEAVAERPQKASGPRKSTGKLSAAGTKTQTKTATNTSRPTTKTKNTLNPKSLQNPEGSASKGPTQKVIRRVHAIVEVPIKVEDDDEELTHDLVNVRKGRVSSNKGPNPPTAIRKAARVVEPTRTNGKPLPSCMDGDGTPPAPLPRRRKSGIDREYLEPDEDQNCYRSEEDVNVRHRPPPRRKSIKELKNSDFEYLEDEEEEGEESDELNLGVRSLFFFDVYLNFLLARFSLGEASEAAAKEQKIKPSRSKIRAKEKSC